MKIHRFGADVTTIPALDVRETEENIGGVFGVTEKLSAPAGNGAVPARAINGTELPCHACRHGRSAPGSVVGARQEPSCSGLLLLKTATSYCLQPHLSMRAQYPSLGKVRANIGAIAGFRHLGNGEAPACRSLLPVALKKVAPEMCRCATLRRFRRPSSAKERRAGPTWRFLCASLGDPRSSGSGGAANTL